jgi:hypothetical protein
MGVRDGFLFKLETTDGDDDADQPPVLFVEEAL